MIDRYSGWPCVSPLARTDTQSVIACLGDWMMDFGIPVSLRTDGGPQFRSEFHKWCEELKIVHELSSAYYPISNGHAEAGVKSMKMLLEKHKCDWVAFRQALLHWRNMPRADGLSPAQRVFNRNQRTRNPAHPSTYHRLTEGQIHDADTRRRECKEYTSDLYDSHSRELPKLQAGSLVRVQDPQNKKWEKTAVIKEPREDGRSYVIESEGRWSVRNRRHLIPISIESLPQSKPSDHQQTPPSSVARDKGSRIKKPPTRLNL